MNFCALISQNLVVLLMQPKLHFQSPDNQKYANISRHYNTAVFSVCILMSAVSQCSFFYQLTE